MGVSPLDLHPQDAVSDDRGRGHIPFRIPLSVSSEGTKRIHYGPSEQKFRVLDFNGIMLAATGTSVVLQNSDGDAISDVINVAALIDMTRFACATIDNAYWDIDPNAGEGLRIVVVGAVVARLWIDCEPRE